MFSVEISSSDLHTPHQWKRKLNNAIIYIIITNYNTLATEWSHTHILHTSREKMNKNIIAISMVKNENDIIETFCRYTLGYCDKLLILEDGSDDTTPDILKSLVNEGLPIVIYEQKTSIGFDKYNIINNLARDAFEIHHADLVIPLDADEFITTDTGIPIRQILEELSDDKIYLLNWRTYILTKTVLQREGTILQRFSEYRPRELEEFTKTLVSEKLFVKEHYKIALGQHDLIPSDNSPIREIFTLDNLIMAHFPIRSRGQLETKVIIGWLNYLSMPNGMQKSGHWPVMYENIKQNGELSFEQTSKMSLFYAVFDETVNQEDETYLHRLTDKPVNTDLVTGKEQLVSRYSASSPDSDVFKVLLPHMEKIITGFKAEVLKQELLNNEKTIELATIQGSRSWKLIRKVRRIFSTR
jgi:hypothetical protein